MIRYIMFKNKYKSIFANYVFYPNVKYMLKNEDEKYYYTILNVRVKKSLINDLYIIKELSSFY